MTDKTLKTAFNIQAQDAKAVVARDMARVQAFFQDVVLEMPRITDELTVVVGTPDTIHFLMRPAHDHRIASWESVEMRSNRSAYVSGDRICVYVGPDNAYEKLGASLENVLAHEFGHWLDGAGHRRMELPDALQRAESIADVFAGLWHLRRNPGDKQAVARGMRRNISLSRGRPNHAYYTLPAVAQLLSQCDTLDLSRKTPYALLDVARDIVAQTSLTRGRKPRPAAP